MRQLAPTAWLAALATAVAFSAPLSAATNCPTGRPVLTGPTLVQSGESYSVAWTDVLPQTGATDYYVLQRSADASFASAVDEFPTTRATQSLPPQGEPSASVLYHRVVVRSTCPTAGFAIVMSDVLAIRFTSDCASPGELAGGIKVTPEDPPAFTTYVLTWDSGVGGPGPGGAPSITYRLRRTSAAEGVRQWVTKTGSASFSDATGDYSYEVRAETSCGAAGPWSAPTIVHVGTKPVSALAVTDEPKPIVSLAAAAPPATRFTVRNTGTVPLDVTARSIARELVISPASFSIGPYQTQVVTVALNSNGATERPFHGIVDVNAPGAAITVPIDFAVGTAIPSGPVAWSDTDLDIGAGGGSVIRSIVNTGTAPAAIVTMVNQPWLVLSPVNSYAWDEPLAPGETRLVKISIDRSRRRAETGTEVGTITVYTVGFPDAPQVLQVVDDGPSLPVATGPRPDPSSARTRLIYAAMPNALNASGSGRFSSDLWIANLDPLTATDVSVHLTPLNTAANHLTYSFSTRLQPGETRRYRNLVAKMLGTDMSCEMEIRSPNATLSATALVNNTPLAPVSSAAALRPMGTASATPGQYGFEMRPTRPGEGVSFHDQSFVLTGLLQNANRRTNLLLTETSGNETKVEVTLLDRFGLPITKGGAAVKFRKTVPALGTVEVLASEMFDDGATYPGSVYARVDFVDGVPDSWGVPNGAVVPFATVIDNTTNDASLRVGVSVTALDPSGSTTPTPSGARSVPASTGAIPFGGGPAPLMFPSAHLIGGPLGSGSVPFWRTRVSFTNTGTSDRALRLTFYGSDQVVRHTPVPLPARSTFTIDDILGSPLGFDIPESLGVYGPIQLEVANDGSYTWKDVDVATETYTIDPSATGTARGQYATGMEGFSYRHGYSSFQSNLGTVQIDGAESSSRYRTNLILQEVGGAYCQVAISAYLRGSFVPIATVSATVPPFGYISKELFTGWLGLDLSELTDVRVVVRQLDGDGVYMAFASKINLTTGDPANIFLRPALAGTGR